MKLRATTLLVPLALGLLAASLPVEAQKPGRVYRIGWLGPTYPSGSIPVVETFLNGLRDLGWVEGQNFVIEYRRLEGEYERLPALADELVRLKVDVIVTSNTPSTRAAKNATRTIPVVFMFVSDPVRSGFVASLARPGGNVTGLTIMAPDLAGKRLELLTETVPGIRRVAILADPTNPAVAPVVKQVLAAAKVQGVTVPWMKVRDPKDFEPAFSAMSKERVDAVIVLTTALIVRNLTRIAQLALEHRLPTMSISPSLPQAGGLMSYNLSYPAMILRGAAYVDKVLKGAKPADLPVEQPTKFELWINMKTAKALGLTIPPSILFRADKVIK